MVGDNSGLPKHVKMTFTFAYITINIKQYCAGLVLWSVIQARGEAKSSPPDEEGTHLGYIYTEEGSQL